MPRGDHFQPLGVPKRSLERPRSAVAVAEMTTILFPDLKVNQILAEYDVVWRDIIDAAHSGQRRLPKVVVDANRLSRLHLLCACSERTMSSRSELMKSRE